MPVTIDNIDYQLFLPSLRHISLGWLFMASVYSLTQSFYHITLCFVQIYKCMAFTMLGKIQVNGFLSFLVLFSSFCSVAVNYLGCNIISLLFLTILISLFITIIVLLFVSGQNKWSSFRGLFFILKFYIYFAFIVIILTV